MRTSGRIQGHGRAGRRGSAMVYVIVFISVLASMAFSLVMTSMGSMRAQRGAREEANAVFLAQGAISEAYFALENGGDGQLGAANDRRFYGGGSYWVDAVEAGGIRTLLATCEAGSSEARVELTLRETSTNLFAWGAFGDESLDLDSNARIDSYNSSAGSYASQVGGGGFANGNGDSGSNGSIVLRSNARVYGDATPGPGYSTTLLGISQVHGSTAANTSIVDLPEIEVPPLTLGGSITGNTSIPSGSHAYSQLRLNANRTVTVTGPATLVFGSFELRSNSQFLVDATNGPVEIFVINDFILSSNTLVASYDESPLDISLNLLSDNVIDPDMEVELDEVDLESNAKLYGTIYAPNAAIEINSNFELFGAIVARSLLLDSNSRIHYDELLATAATDAVVTYEVIAQRVLK